jgi:hypothetical protein
MNGKMAKMLRKMGKDSKANKRMFNSFSAVVKGKLRNAVDNFKPAPSVVAEPIGLDETAPV